MAARGDIAIVIKAKFPVCRALLTLAVQPTGNGPITNTGVGSATPFAVIKILDPRGADMNIGTRADSSGIWSVYDLCPGTFYAAETAASRQWRIDVASDLSFVVTPVTSTFPGDASSGYIG